MNQDLQIHWIIQDYQPFSMSIQKANTSVQLSDEAKLEQLKEEELEQAVSEFKNLPLTVGTRSIGYSGK